MRETNRLQVCNIGALNNAIKRIADLEEELSCAQALLEDQRRWITKLEKINKENNE